MEKRLLHIHGCRGAGWKTILSMIRDDPGLEQVFKMTVTDLKSRYRMSLQNASRFHLDLHLHSPEETFSFLLNKAITPLTVFDQEYPQWLKQIFDPPWVLYCKGDCSILSSNLMLSVVGTRKPHKDARKVVDRILSPIVKEGFTIVSGLAYGIDRLAHETAMQQNGRTIAVLGSGFDHIYPKENRHLAASIASSDLLLSEYPPGRQPARWQFPQRNRVISGLSQGTLIVEAKKKSGSLITADQALQQGRDVFAVPGSVMEENFEGSNWLIQQGAKLILNGEDILTELLLPYSRK
ncbi:DNA-processing protein DprA [Pseudalkalibacillus caeni]|nr:DNA-processing protein DprA [Pseudalkalibacillus caeni]